MYTIDPEEFILVINISKIIAPWAHNDFLLNLFFALFSSMCMSPFSEPDHICIERCRT